MQDKKKVYLMVYCNGIKNSNKIVTQIGLNSKLRHVLELLTPGTITLFGSKEKKYK